MNNHTKALKLILLVAIFIISIINIKAGANTPGNELPDVDIYNIKLPNLEKTTVIKKGETINLILLENLSTKNKNDNLEVNLISSPGDKLNLRATGFVVKQTSPKRFSRSGTLKLSTNKLYLDDGQELSFSSSAPLLLGAHPPHADTNSIALARTITTLSIATTPVTFGTSLGVSFLVSGVLSAHQNGISDFIWGGFSGIGLSLAEYIFRKQPDINLPGGITLPFTLNKDLKISKGIKKEKIEHINISKEVALNKIQKLLKWGDLSGALEYSLKSNQKDIYEEIIQKISS